MCNGGVDVGLKCRFCGCPLLICWDDGPTVAWHLLKEDETACVEASLEAIQW